MKALTVVMFLVIAALGGTPNPPNCTAGEREAWLSKATTEMQTVKVGMTREDLLKVFTRAGGFFTTSRLAGTYQYKESPYIKVDVEFSEDPGADNDTAESPKDVVQSISKPYLAPPAFD
jgi:hypothetical protein